MIIQLDSQIEQSSFADEEKVILRAIVKAINTLGDARSQIHGDIVFHDSAPVIRASDGNYYRQGIGFSGSTPVTVYTLVGKNPTGE